MSTVLLVLHLFVTLALIGVVLAGALLSFLLSKLMKGTIQVLNHILGGVFGLLLAQQALGLLALGFVLVASGQTQGQAAGWGVHVLGEADALDLARGDYPHLRGWYERQIARRRDVQLRLFRVDLRDCW